MRLPRFRLKLWMLVVAVTVSGLLFGGEVMRRRRAHYLGLAQMYAGMERSDRETAAYFDRSAAANKQIAESARAKVKSLRDNPRNPLLLEELVAREESRAKLHDKFVDSDTASARRSADSAAFQSRLRLKYERAARYPFLPVAPDPPEPE